MERIKETLVELVARSIADTRNKNRRMKSKSNKRIHKPTLRHKSSITPIIISIVTNSLKEGTETKEKQTNDNLENAAEEESEVKEEKVMHGGYGTIKPYTGMSPHVKYTDYSKIWGHLGTFRAYNMFENNESKDIAMKNGESSRQLTSERTMDMAARNFKYFGNNNINNTAQDMTTITSLVPPAGANIDSKEWEKYALMMKMSIYQPLIALKFKFA